jgi:NOL1/NOP2/sun family putative RNA methylase
MLKTIPDAQKYEIKPAFESRYREMLGEQYDEFIKFSTSYIRRSIRVNTLKISIPRLKERLEKDWILTQIPWCKEGFWVEHKSGRRDIGNTLEHALGYCYVQEAASMIPPVVLGPEPGEIVLDMCASPGSKTTQIAQYMENTGVLVANDFKGDRMKPLGLNLKRTGVLCAVLTLMRGQQFMRIGFKFDKVLVDAPCSGTGTIRKSLKTLKIWNSTMISRLAHEQRQLIEVGYSVLKKGGVLVYSTCSCEPEENEKTVDSLIKKFPGASLEKISIDIKRSRPVLEYGKEKYDSRISDALRIWPQDNDTEGFFVARIRKNE